MAILCAWIVRRGSFAYVNTLTTVFSREFKDWHLQWENVFIRLLGNGWSPIKFQFQWNGEMVKNQPSSKHLLHYAHSRSRPILANFGLLWPKCAKVFLGHFFPLGASASRFQGSVSNARGTFQPKTHASSHSFTSSCWPRFNIGCISDVVFICIWVILIYIYIKNPKNGSQNRDLLKFLNRYGIFWVTPGESSCTDGSEYYWWTEEEISRVPVQNMYGKGG